MALGRGRWGGGRFSEDHGFVEVDYCHAVIALVRCRVALVEEYLCADDGVFERWVNKDVVDA